MAKNVGNYLEFWFGAREYPVEAVDYSADFTELDTTDSSSPADATETVLNRAKRSFKVDALLSSALGGEVATGTAVLGTTYLVTAGTVSETPNSYTAGMIFTSNGTGTLSGSNKVKPLGTKLVGKSISCTVATVDTPVTALKFNEEYGEYDSTDSASTGDSTEWITGRAKRSGTIELIQTNTAADLMTTSPVAQAIILTFGSGDALAFSGIFKRKSIVTSAKGDMVKVTYDFNVVGAVTNTMEDMLTPAASTAFIVVWKRGATTHKQVSGNAIVVSTSIEADVNSLVKVSYQLDMVGAPTYAVAN